MYTGDYTPPTLTIDSVIFTLDDKQLMVLLIQRTAEPFKGCYALPGGYCAAGETTTSAMSRVVHAKAGVNTTDLGLIEQLYTFDTVARDPRGHAVSVAYLGLGKELTAGGSGTQQPAFFPVSQLPPLAYDHADIITYARQRLEAKLTYTNAIFALLPKLFTLSELQAGYEAIMGHQLDKRNFRKKFLSLGLIEATNEMRKEGAHRPARLYRFCRAGLQTLTRSFE